MNKINKAKKWKTADGKKVNISEMHDVHLVNAIKKSRSTASARRTQVMALLTNALATLPQDSKARKRMANHIGLVSVSTYKDYVPSAYNNLVEEARSRNLDT